MRFTRQATRNQEFQLAPMVDVLFILLIFFIVTTSYQAVEKELSIALPQADNGSEIEQSGRDIIVNITKDGKFVVNRKTYTVDSLRELMVKVKDLLGSRAVLLRADMETQYDHIVKVMDICAELKIQKISFVTDYDKE